jgi:pantothenate kinase
VTSHGVSSVVLPMDGFHYSREDLRRNDPPDATTLLPRRGAPNTFDAELLVRTLKTVRGAGEGLLPTYSRELSDPIPSGPQLRRDHRVVIVEGNYLLLGSLVTDMDASESERAEASRWAPLLSLFNETWFVAPPNGTIENQSRACVKRHCFKTLLFNQQES